MSEFLMSLKGVSLAFGGPRVLDNVSLSISRGMRAALTGRNGVGKSTLFKVIEGTLEPDEGERVITPGLKIAYVGQNVEESSVALCPLRPTNYPLPSTNYPLPSALCRSGGEIRRARLEKAILSQPDLLLLDEPTNHLDIEAIDWLEGMIRRQRSMAVLIVTHDRRFLRRVATQIFDLDRGELAGWECDYTTFVKRKADLMADEAVYWERKSKKVAQEEAWIRRGVKARTTRNEGRVAALMKLREEFAARRQQLGVSTMRLDTAAAGGEQVLKVKNLSFGYQARSSGEGGQDSGQRSEVKGQTKEEKFHCLTSDLGPLTSPLTSSQTPKQDRAIITNFTATILRGERIGILGRNGAGKTTLLNLLTGRLRPTAGSATFGTGVQLAFLDQLRGELKPDLTVGENVASDRDEVIVGGVKKHVYSYLADFLFPPERVRTPVKALSGGEKARLMLAKLFLKPANLLVMDEPTNDLDIETLELLEEQLLNYRGTLLLVSHDREFLDNVVTSTFALEGDGKVESYPGGYSDYIAQRDAAKAGKEGQTSFASVAAKPAMNAKQASQLARIGVVKKRPLPSARPERVFSNNPFANL